MFPSLLILFSLHVLSYWKQALLVIKSVNHSQQTEPQNEEMASDSKGQAFYIITVSGGTVVEKSTSGLLDKDASGDKAQHWTLEYDGDSETKVAFQNASNGQYLNCTSGAAYGKIDTSGTKQWWTLEKGKSPGSYW